jgi:cell volume regulation protein A
MSATAVNLTVLAGALVVLVAVGAVRLAVRVGLPSLLLYLAIGMLLGQDGLGVRFDDATLAQHIGLIALALILAEGGLTTRWVDIRPAVPAAALLATVGVAVSVTVTAAAAHLMLSLPWRSAVILGAVVSSTDAAAVFATLRTLRLPRRLVGVLEAESGLNDAPVVIVVVLLSRPSQPGLGMGALTLAYELAAGAAIGLAVAAVAVLALRRSVLPSVGLYPVAALAFALTSYAAAAAAGASGFLAIYLCGLRIGNAALPHRRAVLGFAEALAWLAQIGLFVMLGLLVEPSRLAGAVGPALALGAALLLAARPLSVLASASWFRMPLRDQVLLSWAGLRGAVPIVLATIPLTTGVAGAQRIFDTVFVLVAAFTLVQGPTLTPLARRLGLVRGGEPRELSVESAPLDDMHSDLLQVRIPDGSRLNGVEVFELRLPAGAAICLVVQNGRAIVPEPDTRLRSGDQLLVVTSYADREATERRLRAVGRSGRLAKFLGDDGQERG